MKLRDTEKSLLTAMDILSNCEMTDEQREGLFALIGWLISDKAVLDKRAKQILINRESQNGRRTGTDNA